MKTRRQAIAVVLEGAPLDALPVLTRVVGVPHSLLLVRVEATPLNAPNLKLPRVMRINEHPNSKVVAHARVLHQIKLELPIVEPPKHDPVLLVPVKAARINLRYPRPQIREVVRQPETGLAVLIEFRLCDIHRKRLPSVVPVLVSIGKPKAVEPVLA